MKANYWIGLSVSIFLSRLAGAVGGEIVLAPQETITCGSRYEDSEPIFFAVGSPEDVEYVNRLLTEGANLKARWGFGCFTPLASVESLEVARLLVERGGADVNAVSDQGQSILSYQIQWRNAKSIPGSPTHGKFIELIRYFLSKGANPNLIPWQPSNQSAYEAPLLQAVQRGDGELVSLLIDEGNANIEIRGALRGTALHKALWTKFNPQAYKHRLEVIKALLDRGADIEAKDRDEATPLYLAFEQDDAEAARLLMSRGANVDYYNEKRFLTMLTKATFYLTDLELYRELAGRVKHINQRGDFGDTALNVVINGTDKLSQAKAKILRDLGGCTQMELIYRTCATPNN